MNYTKYSLGSYNLHTIKTDQFKNITIKINFKRLAKKEEITIRNLLADILTRSTKKYHTERLMNIVVEDLYGINFTGNTTVSGNYNIMSFTFSFLHEKYTEKGIFSKTIDFIYDLLFDPNIEKESFLEENFILSKNTMKMIIESIEENPERLSMRGMLEEMAPDTPTSYHSDGYMEDLEKITAEDLYKYYKNMIQKDILDIFIIGDIDSHVKTIIENKINIHTFKKRSQSHYIRTHKPRFRSKTIRQAAPFNQSKLAIGANIVGETNFERDYVSYVYSYILGGGADSQLFKSVREENSLCYYIYSQVYRLSHILTICSGIDKKNAPKAISLIKKELKKMAQGKFTDEDIMKAQVTYISSLKEVLDSPPAILNMYVSKEYLGLDMMEERISKIGKVSKKEVQDFAKKVKINTIYLLEGNLENEETNTD